MNELWQRGPERADECREGSERDQGESIRLLFSTPGSLDRLARSFRTCGNAPHFGDEEPEMQLGRPTPTARLRLVFSSCGDTSQVSPPMLLSARDVTPPHWPITAHAGMASATL